MCVLFCDGQQIQREQRCTGKTHFLRQRGTEFSRFHVHKKKKHLPAVNVYKVAFAVIDVIILGSYLISYII